MVSLIPIDIRFHTLTNQITRRDVRPITLHQASSLPGSVPMRVVLRVTYFTEQVSLSVIFAPRRVVKYKFIAVWLSVVVGQCLSLSL